MTAPAQPLRMFPQAEAPQLKGLLVDIFERALIGGLGLWFVYRVYPHVGVSPTNLLVLISTVMSAVIILIRRRGPAASGTFVWTITLVATFGSMLLHPGGDRLIPIHLAIGLMTAGLLLNISSKIVLRRSFGLLPANRGVETEGTYRLVRHPIYLGYFLTESAYVLVNATVNNMAVFVMGWSAMVLRILAEERFLSEDPAYRAYRARVPYRLLPGIW